jgi:hypothetical protein
MIDVVIAEANGAITESRREAAGVVQARSCWMPIQAAANSERKFIT